MIGFTTGVLKHLDLTLTQKVEHLSKLKPKAIEVSFNRPHKGFWSLTDKEIDRIERATTPCRYTSIHAPAADVTYGADKETGKMLARLKEIARALHPQLIVFHTNTVNNPDLLGELDLPIAFENMDPRKESGLLPGDMEEFLRRHPDIKIVLDITHVGEVNPQFDSFDRILEEFGRRAVELHLSGSSEDDKHIPLHRSNQPKIVEAYRKAKEFNAPVILEGHVDPENAEEELAKELEFVRGL